MEETKSPGAAGPETSTRGQVDDLIDVRFLFGVWLRWSWLVLVLAAVGAYFGVQSARNHTPQYTAKMIVQPAGGSENLSGAAVQLTSALGLGLPTAGRGATFGRFEVLLSSVTLAQRLDKKYGLLREVFAGSWDAQSESWIEPTGPSYQRQQRVRRFFRRSEWSPPSLEDLARYVVGSVAIDPTPGEGFFEVTVRHQDPEFALRLLKLTYQEADDLTREQDLEESERRRLYIRSRLSSADLVDTREALINLLTAEERKAMLLESDLPYAARIIEPPFVSNRPEEIDIRLMIAVPAIIWGGLGLLLITFVALIRRV